MKLPSKSKKTGITIIRRGDSIFCLTHCKSSDQELQKGETIVIFAVQSRHIKSLKPLCAYVPNSWIIIRTRVRKVNRFNVVLCIHVVLHWGTVFFWYLEKKTKQTCTLSAECKQRPSQKSQQKSLASYLLVGGEIKSLVSTVCACA